jgi:16S rRNA (cytosine967-C5)-methyltransferase
MNQQVVVQDINSQKVVPLLLNVFSMSDTFSVWDCCAASGGKAIQLHDLFPDSKLLVSDIRSSILNNLQERFRQAGIHTYTAQLLDLSKAVSMDDQFDVIVADVPCSGSGTWSRTPEQLRCFSANQIKDYVVLQQKILTNVLPSLKAGGYLLYSTCSVFRDENESQIKWLEEKFQLKTIDSGLLLEKKLSSDILYAALLQKN